MHIDPNLLDNVSDHERRTQAINFLASESTLGELLHNAKGESSSAHDARVLLACVLLMAKTDAPEDIRASDPQTYKRLRDRITEIRLAGWLG